MSFGLSQYSRLYDALRERIEAGEFEVGERLPSIAELQEAYDVHSLGTVRAAQQMLVEDGLIRTEQGRGAFVVSTRSARDLDVDEALGQIADQIRDVRNALTAQQVRRVTINLDDPDHDHASFVLTQALRDFADRCRDRAADRPEENGELHLAWAGDAEWILELVDEALNRTNVPQQEEGEFMTSGGVSWQ